VWISSNGCVCFAADCDDVNVFTARNGTRCNQQRQSATTCDERDRSHVSIGSVGRARQTQRSLRGDFNEIQDFPYRWIARNIVGFNIRQPLGQRAFV
jgi:hypothetical protein